MSEHWPEVVQVCSALGVTPGVKAGALCGRCRGQDGAVGLIPLLGQQMEPLPARAQRCRSCCSLEGTVQLFGVLALLRGGSWAAPWFYSQTVQLH